MKMSIGIGLLLAVSAVRGGDLESYQLIVERNVFDANRLPKRAVVEEEPVTTQVRIDEIQLAGIAANRGVYHAFFEGSEADFRGKFTQGMQLADFEIIAVTANEVTVAVNGESMVWPVGAVFKREAGQEWALSAHAPRFLTAANMLKSEPKIEHESGGSAADILKRLMEQRKQEVK